MMDLSYWKGLKVLDLYSQQSWKERYIAIYTWKALESYVPNPSNKNKIPTTSHSRTGHHCTCTCWNQNPAVWSTTVLEYSIVYQETKGTSLAAQRINYKVQAFLRTIPDKSSVPKYTALCRATKNSTGPTEPIQYRINGLGGRGGPPRL